MLSQEPFENSQSNDETWFRDQVDDLIQCQLPVRWWVTDVEEAVSLHLSLRNGGPVTASFEIVVIGLVAEWLAVPAETITLGPGQQQPLSLVLVPPRLSDSRAGEHRFILRVTSPAYPGRYAQQWAVLRINPFYELALGQLAPKRQMLSWSGQAALYSLSLENKGNNPTHLHLDSSDLQRECHFEYCLPGQEAALTGQVDFSLGPGEQVSLPIRVTPIRKAVAGFPRIYPFTVTVTSLQGQRLPRSILGQLVIKPLLGPGMLSMLVFALAIFFFILLSPVVESAWQGTPVVLNFKTQAEVSQKTSGLIPFLRALKATPTPPVEPTRLPETYEEMFQEIAAQHNLDWRVLEAVAYYESRMNYLALGQSHDMGLMQVIPATWNQWAPKVGVYDPYDPYSNIAVGGAYLAYVRDFCVQRGHPEPHWMLVAYNWGPQRVEQLFAEGGGWEQVPDTQRRYALSILERASNRAAGLE